MSVLPNLITDLALILGVAAVVTLLFKWIKFPLVLGYLIAGMLISPHFRLFPSIYDISDVQVWGEIGVIFLLFGLGLEFSFKKLAKMGGPASITAGFEAVGMAIIGYTVGKFLGWPEMDSIFLAACLTISSSTVIIKTFDDLNLTHRNFAGLVFGVLVVEDIIAVTLLVLLGSFVVTQEIDCMQIFYTILKLVFFIMLWFLSGILFVPSLLKKSKKFLTDEILLIVAIAMCFIMVFFSTKAGFSAALGAFVMGSLLSETTKAERIMHLIRPVRDLFGAIFFVSMGMLIDLHVISQYICPILIISAAVIIGKTVVIGTGAYISGNSLKTSLQTGMSLTLIGEFSFIIIALGAKYNAIGDHLYPVIIAVSAITIFISPSLTLSSTKVYNWLYKQFPQRWQDRINRYSVEASSLRTVSDWRRVLRTYVINCSVYSVILLALVIGTTSFLFPWLASINFEIGRITSVILTLLLMSPFLWALVIRNQNSQSYRNIYSQNKFKGPIWVMRLIKILLGVFFIIFLLRRVFSLHVALYAAIVILVFLIVFRHWLQKLYDRIEERFITNLHNREIEAQNELALAEAQKRNSKLGPWDAHMTTFDVPSEATHIIGKTLNELQWRERIGINVAMIKRGQISIVNPDRDEKIYPGDKLYIICTDTQEKRMAAILREDKQSVKNTEEVEMKLDRFFVDDNCLLINKSIREADLRNRIHGLVVGIERNGERILNPESDMLLLEGDIVWIVGDKKLLKEPFLRQN